MKPLDHLIYESFMLSDLLENQGGGSWAATAVNC